MMLRFLGLFRTHQLIFAPGTVAGIGRDDHAKNHKNNHGNIKPIGMNLGYSAVRLSTRRAEPVIGCVGHHASHPDELPVLVATAMVLKTLGPRQNIICRQQKAIAGIAGVWGAYSGQENRACSATREGRTRARPGLAYGRPTGASGARRAGPWPDCALPAPPVSAKYSVGATPRLFLNMAVKALALS